MGSTRHEKSFVDFEKPYEQNIVGLKGIIYFALGLFILIVITFGLMWVLFDVLEDSVAESKRAGSPLALSEAQRLPPEPRLQAAPGWRVESSTGPANLELQAPQSEYWVLRREWQRQWRQGIRDERTGAVTQLPIDEAKKRFLQQQSAAPAAADAGSLVDQSQLYLNDSSAGRQPTLRRR